MPPSDRYHASPRIRFPVAVSIDQRCSPVRFSPTRDRVKSYPLGDAAVSIGQMQAHEYGGELVGGGYGCAACGLARPVISRAMAATCRKASFRTSLTPVPYTDGADAVSFCQAHPARAPLGLPILLREEAIVPRGNGFGSGLAGPEGSTRTHSALLPLFLAGP